MPNDKLPELQNIDYNLSELKQELEKQTAVALETQSTTVEAQKLTAESQRVTREFQTMVEAQFAKGERDLQELRRAILAHSEDERPKLIAMQTRHNVTLALVLSACIFALAGDDGMVKLGEMLSGSGLSVEAFAMILGIVLPIIAPFSRKIFANIFDGGDHK